MSHKSMRSASHQANMQHNKITCFTTNMTNTITLYQAAPILKQKHASRKKLRPLLAPRTHSQTHTFGSKLVSIHNGVHSPCSTIHQDITGSSNVYYKHDYKHTICNIERRGIHLPVSTTMASVRGKHKPCKGRTGNVASNNSAHRESSNGLDTVEMEASRPR